MKLAAIIEALGHVGLTDYPNARVAGAASALLEAYREAVKTKTAAVLPPAAVDEVEPAAGRSGFDMRREKF